MLVSDLTATSAASDLYISTGILKFFNRYYNSLHLYIGNGQQSNKNGLDFKVSLGRSEVLVGDSSKVNWGVECGATEAADSTCQISQVFLFSIYIFYNDSEHYLLLKIIF